MISYSAIGQQPVDQLTNANKSSDFETGQQLVDQTDQFERSFSNLLSLIPWGHHIQIITKTNNTDEALFYIQQTAVNNWSRNVLVHQIESGLYKRKGKAQNNFELTLP